MERVLDADYLVVGAGATGMAFTDALIDHADVRVAMVDRRQTAGGHWRDAYPFVRLHQASAFYGVASTLLGSGQLQTNGPEVGLHERAGAADICAYYDEILADRMLSTGKVQFLGGCDYVGNRSVVSRSSGEQFGITRRCRIVDARFLAPDIPANTPPSFEVADGARMIPINELNALTDTPSQFVIVGSGKSATDAIVWILTHGVQPDKICWIRSRDPWMLNRAVVQPNPVVFLGMVADTMQTAGVAASLKDFFLRLEDAGILLRIDRSVMPTMAKTPVLAAWELDHLRTVDHVVRLGHILRVQPGRITLEHGSVPIAKDAVVVHCAASGLKYPPNIPIWGPSAITVQPIRAGFPCFGAALTGYVEATRNDDAEKNRLCPPTPFPDTMTSWARMTVLGARATMSFNSEADIKEWADDVPLNPARVPPEHPDSAALDDVMGRLQTHMATGLARLAEWST